MKVYGMTNCIKTLEGLRNTICYCSSQDGNGRQVSGATLIPLKFTLWVVTSL